MPTKINLPPGMPRAMRQLPKDEAGRPIPFFVPMVDGKPDFRLADTAKMATAERNGLCLLCGTQLHRVRQTSVRKGTFVAGPMCLINGVSSEPPHHLACAEWSVRACPFLTKPLKERRRTALPDEASTPGGIMIERNPGVSALITSWRWSVFKADYGGEGLLWSFSAVADVVWMAEGRDATLAEVLESIETGIGQLVDNAVDFDGNEASRPAAMHELARNTKSAMRWLPPGAWEKDDYPTIAAVLAHG